MLKQIFRVFTTVTIKTQTPVNCVYWQDVDTIIVSGYNGFGASFSRKGKLKKWNLQVSNAPQASNIWGKKYVVLSRTPGIYIYYRNTIQQRIEIPTLLMATALGMNPTETIIAYGNGDGLIRFYTPTGEKLKSFQAHDGWIRFLAFSPDGNLLASCADDGKVKLWNVENSKSVDVFYGHRDAVISVQFSPDGQYLASSDTKGGVKIWKM